MNDQNLIDDFVAFIVEQTNPGDLIPTKTIERYLKARKGEPAYARLEKRARKILERHNIRLDGYGHAKGQGLRRLSPDEMFDKTGAAMRGLNRKSKRALKECGLASGVCTNNTQIRVISARADTASRVAAMTTAKAIQIETEKDHARPLSPREIWAMKQPK